MPKFYEGQLDGVKGRFAIIVSRYNETVTGKLLNGAVETLLKHGIADADIHVAWVPGAFELPAAANQMAKSGNYAGVIVLGAVIRGETTHDQHINRAVSLGITEITMQTGLPVMFGLLTCDSLEQALSRSGGSMGNKGIECAEAALRMVSLLKSLD